MFLYIFNPEPASSISIVKLIQGPMGGGDFYKVPPFFPNQRGTESNGVNVGSECKFACSVKSDPPSLF